jgi:signal peptidase II
MSSESVSSESEAEREAAPVSEQTQDAPHGHLTWLVIAVATAVWLLDQASKLVIVHVMADRADLRLLGGLITITYTRNPGAAFSVGTGTTWAFTLVAVVVAVVIIRTSRRLGSKWWAVCLGGLLGGAVGNLTDRIFRAPGIFRGHVVDFIHPSHFAVFNLADAAITCSAIGMILLSLLGVELDGRRR